jgi:hypothetical protein
MLPLLLLLIGVPIVAWYWAGKRTPRHRWLITGSSFGAIASPWSLGLYSTFFIPIVGLPSGLAGLFLSLVHGAPGFEIAKYLGLVAPMTVVEDTGHLYVAVLNAIVWGFVYGAIGWGIDRIRTSRQRVDNA